jgi:hypothetical protein
MDEISKKINITGTNNKYMIKKIENGYKKEIKKRLVSEKWKFSEEYYEYESQIKLIRDIIENNYSQKDEMTKLAINEINKKISNYKNQDNLKKHLDNEKFLTLKSVLNKMEECELKCRYCKCKMSVLYDISREMTQWSVDRIDNDKGHNIDNFHLACLNCNLKRRRRTDEKFLFTKELNIVKHDN